MKQMSVLLHALYHKLRRPFYAASVLALSAVTWQLPAQAATNTVSVSNYPLYLLSEAVTKGTPSAQRILKPGNVGHHGSMSPSDKKMIQDSTFVVWFGPSLENSLSGTLEDAPNDIALLDFDAFKRYPLRDIQTKPISNTEDPHIWLDPNNAKAITRALAAIHTHANPQYKDIYQANVKDFAKRMDAAVRQVQQESPSFRDYWAYHDAIRCVIFRPSQSATLKTHISGWILIMLRRLLVHWQPSIRTPIRNTKIFIKPMSKTLPNVWMLRCAKCSKNPPAFVITGRIMMLINILKKRLIFA